MSFFLRLFSVPLTCEAAVVSALPSSVRAYGLTGVVFLVSSVFLTVPSGFWVTVVSFDLTVPSLLTLVFSVLESVWLHPMAKRESARANIVVSRFCGDFIGV